MAYAGPHRLHKRHVLTGFSCGEEALDDWLARHARTANGAGSANVFVVEDLEERRVVGFHALSAGEVARSNAPTSAARQMPAAIPVLVLGRLAVDTTHQGTGLGAALLKDAMTRAVSAAASVGARALVVHAKNERARAWYLTYDFEPSPTDELHLWLRIRDIAASLGD